MLHEIYLCHSTAAFVISAKPRGKKEEKKTEKNVEKKNPNGTTMCVRQVPKLKRSLCEESCDIILSIIYKIWFFWDFLSPPLFFCANGNRIDEEKTQPKGKHCPNKRNPLELTTFKKKQKQIKTPR